MDTAFSVPLVPFNYFKSYLLPPLHPELDVDTILDRLTEDGDIVQTQLSDKPSVVRRWKYFPKDPSVSESQEDEIFAPLAIIAERVAFHATSLLESSKVSYRQTVEFLCDTTTTPISSTIPPSYGVLRQRTDRLVRNYRVPNWDDIVIPGETKKQDDIENFDDNNVKIMWSLTRGMRETVQRRFMFGYTIEDAHMRLWFCTRSDIIVSEQFNFITDPSETIHFFLSVMFAKPTELGFDPTISTVFYAEKQQQNVYNITVNWKDSEQRPRHTTFRTTEVLANASVESIRGRGTRVWRGYPLGDDSTPIVVKDCWIDDDRQREADVLADILQAAMKKDEEGPLAMYVSLIKQHFLEVVCHGDVLIDGKEDNTFTLLRRGAPLPADSGVLQLQRTAVTKDTNKGSIGTPTLGRDASKASSVMNYTRKTHYRVVFKSTVACKPIDTVTSVGKLFYLLSQTLDGLNALHDLGWLHRDISPGNILVEGEDGPAKITDLEYCKRIDDYSPAHSGRTGTPYFIPVEVDRQAYLFRPKPPSGETDPQASRGAGLSLLGRRTRKFGERIDQSLQFPAAPSVPVQAVEDTAADFIANTLHDLESLWWLAVYLTIPRRVEGSAAFDVTAQKRAERWASSMFTDTASRVLVMKDSAQFSEGIRLVDPRLKETANALEKARERLVEAHANAERNFYTSGIDIGATNTLHPQFRAIFENLLDELENTGDVKLSTIPITYLQISTSSDTPAGGSLGPRAAPLILGKHPRNLDNVESEHGDDTTRTLTRQISALPSPTRGSSKRMKREATEEVRRERDEVIRSGKGSGQ